MSRHYVVDIDGTLSDVAHRLHFLKEEPPNWDAFYEACDGDPPIREVVDTIRMLGSRLDMPVTKFVYITGRRESVRAKTKAWLEEYQLPYGELLMRRDGDFRPDEEVKPELLGQFMERRVNVEVFAVFEDRPSVCRKWRALGFTVFQLTHEEF